jgi:acid phosphatase family membrane protein YuiD
VKILAVLDNAVLGAALSAWLLAQLLKLPVEYVRSRNWNWALLLRAGGMPSSHSALVAALAHAVGLVMGFGTGLFAASVVLAVIVVYDAAGIRRQAGRHAEIINAIMRDLIEERHLRPERLREVLGHSPLEAALGVALGVLVAQVFITVGAR